MDDITEFLAYISENTVLLAVEIIPYYID